MFAVQRDCRPVGEGLREGICAKCRQRRIPQKVKVVLEAKETLGGRKQGKEGGRPNSFVRPDESHLLTSAEIQFLFSKLAESTALQGDDNHGVQDGIYEILKACKDCLIQSVF